jgi:hypothetical protein
MPSVNIDSIVKTTLNKSEELAKTLFREYVGQAGKDVSDFLQNAKEGIERATKLRLEGKIDDEDLEDLILGKKDLALMHALKEVGLAKATVDTFVNGVMQILIDAVFAAIP